MASTHVETRSD